MSLDTSLLLAAAAAAAAGQQYPRGMLYVVATPIGNLADITLRALHVLSLADVVACEDTRVGASLLRHYGLHKPLLALYAHNERVASTTVLERLARDERVALISDAGTPAVSDPGSALVAAARAAGYHCMPLPGSSSVLAALCVAGDASADGFVFVGFVPARGTLRDAALAAVAASAMTQVLFEAPHRIASLATALAARCGSRPVTLCRELTKQFETVDTLTAAELPAWLQADTNRSRGEFVLVLHAQAVAAAGDDGSERVLRAMLREQLPLKQAVALTAEITGAARNELYARALAMRQAGA